MLSGNKYSPAVTLVGVALYSASTYASFNSFCNGPLCSNYGCVVSIAAIAGIFVIPLSILIFWALFRMARHGGTPQSTPIWWVVGNGAVAYVIAIVLLLLGSSRAIAWAYAYLAYAVLFVTASYFIGHKLPR